MHSKAHSEESLAGRTLVLPGGLLNRAGEPCRRVDVRPLTGADEEALFECGQAAAGSAGVTAFLSRAIAAIDGLDMPVDETLVAQMPLGDRDYLLLRIRQIELGDAVHQVTRCPACTQKVDVDFAISELPVRRLEALQPAYRIMLGDEPALVRLPTGAGSAGDRDAGAVESLGRQHGSVLARGAAFRDAAPPSETTCARGR